MYCFRTMNGVSNIYYAINTLADNHSAFSTVLRLGIGLERREKNQNNVPGNDRVFGKTCQRLVCQVELTAGYD